MIKYYIMDASKIESMGTKYICCKITKKHSLMVLKLFLAPRVSRVTPLALAGWAPKGAR